MKFKKIIIALLSICLLYIPFTFQSGNVDVQAASQKAPFYIGILNQKLTSVRGIGEANAQITVYLPNGKTSSGVANKWGEYNVALPKGTALVARTSVKVVHKNTRGIVSVKTEPVFELIEAPKINPIHNGDSSVSGLGKPGNELYVDIIQHDTKGNAYSFSRRVVTDAHGRWFLKLEKRLLNATVTGRYTYYYGGVYRSVDRLIGYRSVVTPPITNVFGTKVITGTAPARSTVRVTFPNGKAFEDYVSNDTQWSINVPYGVVLKPGQALKVEILGYVAPSMANIKMPNLTTAIVRR